MSPRTGMPPLNRLLFPSTIIPQYHYSTVCCASNLQHVKYVVWKDRKCFLADLKLVYDAINREMAYEALEEFSAKWNAKYAYAVKSWKDNWDELTAYFDYPIEIRRIINTTNVIERLNSTIRKYTKTKTVFPIFHRFCYFLMNLIGNGLP
jgi:putative transposase